jgi:hypothetical protein
LSAQIRVEPCCCDLPVIRPPALWCCSDTSVDNRRKLVEEGLPDEPNKAIAPGEHVPVRQRFCDGEASLVCNPRCTEPQPPGCFGGELCISFGEARGARLALAVDAEDDENGAGSVIL